MPSYRRVILKISGEALRGPGGNPLSLESARRLGAEIAAAAECGTQIGVVIGGGNILRGVSVAPSGRERLTADYMGMLATQINGLALADALRAAGRAARVASAIPCGPFGDLYSANAVDGLLASGEIVVLTAGTGNPFFSTDTAAALRAAELEADALLKATKVDGIYDSDPVTSTSAARFDEIGYREFIERRLGVMDLTAVSLCRDRRLPVIVFGLAPSGNIARAVAGDRIGSVVKEV